MQRKFNTLYKLLNSKIRCQRMFSDDSKASPTEPTVLVDYQGNVSILTLNRPKALNASNVDMVRSIKSEINKWNQDPSTKVAIFKGKGRAFSAGGDLSFFYKAINSKSIGETAKAMSQERYTMDYMIATMRPIQIAIWDGIVMGGGVGLSIHAPIRIATENSLFAMPEAKAGLFTDVGSGYFLSRIRNHIGYFLGLTAMALKGKELVQVGVADFFVKKENLVKLEQDIVQSTNLKTSVEDLRAIVRKYEEPIEKKYANEDLIEELFNKDSLEKVFDAVRSSETNKEFTQKIFDTLNTLSPLSLKVIFTQLQRGKELDLRDNLRMDLRLIVRFFKLPDMAEGIRCMVIDKGSKPRWSYKSIYDIPQEEVEKLFAPLEDDTFLANSKL